MKAAGKLNLIVGSQLLAIALLTSGCAADFLFEGKQQTNHEDECDCNEPHPSPSPSLPPEPRPSPTPKPTCPPKPPPVVQCDLRVILDVAQLKIVRTHGPDELIPIRPGEVDLCELSKDFFGTMSRTLAPQWQAGDQFTKAIFILSSRLERNRVETINGAPICGLRVPPSMTAGVRFEPIGFNPLAVNTAFQVRFDFDQTDALHRIGIGVCQLQHPVGHYDLREAR